MLIALLPSCGDPQPPVDDPWIGWDAGFELEPPLPPEPPTLTPCLDGWQDVAADDAEDVATCEPWPEGGSPAAHPQMTPCPEGWRVVPPASEEGTTTCDPWPEDGAETCASGTAHFPGESACRSVGTTCPTGGGEWAEELPTEGEVLFVLAGAASGGDGSREAPFSSISEAASTARSGSIIALSKGTFDEAVSLRPRVTLWGACAGETVVTCSEPSENGATIRIRGQGAVVRNLTVSGNRLGVLVSGISLSVHLEGVVIDDAESFALGVADGARATANGLVLRDTRPLSGSGQLGRGLQIEGGGEVELSRGVISGNREAGVWITGADSTLIMSDTTVVDTSPGLDPASGFGVFAHEGAHLELERTVLERNNWRALSISGAGTTASIVDVVMRDTALDAEETPGLGLYIANGAEVEATRCALSNNRSFGVLVTDPFTFASFTDVVVRDTNPLDYDDPLVRMGRGMWVTEGARAEIGRGLFERNEEFGLIVSSAGSTASLSDIVIRDTRSRIVDNGMGCGLAAHAAATIDLDRGVIERNRLAGLYAEGADTSITARNVVVRDNLTLAGEQMGWGAFALAGAQVVVEGGDFEANQGTGMLAHGTGTVITASDIVIRESMATEGGLFGRGASAEEGGELRIERALIDGNRDIGAYASDAGSSLHLTDVLIRDTDATSDGYFGRGIEVIRGARSSITRTLVLRNREIGILVGGAESSLRAEDVTVRDTSANRLGEFGRALQIQDGARLELTRALLERNREVSLFASAPGTTALVEDIVVTNTLERECAVDDCSDSPTGIGVGVYGSAHIELYRFAINHNVLCGLQLAHGTNYERERYEDGGTIDLHEGEISGNRIGVNVQTEGFDIDRLLDDVVCSDNERNLDTDELPVPEVGEVM